MKPSQDYPPPEQVPYIIDYAAEQVKLGKLSKTNFNQLEDYFRLGNRVSKLRLMPDQAFSKTLMGFNLGQNESSEQVAEEFTGKDVTKMPQSD